MRIYILALELCLVKEFSSSKAGLKLIKLEDNEIEYSVLVESLYFVTKLLILNIHQKFLEKLW